MPIVRFFPVDKSIDVPSGTLISDAAMKAGVEDLQLACGGKGTCGRCMVQIASYRQGEVANESLTEGSILWGGLVLSCQTKVHGDLAVRIKVNRDKLMRVVGDSQLLVNEEFLPDEDEISAIYRAQKIHVPLASIEAHYSDWQRLVQALCKENGDVPVRADLGILRDLAHVLREKNGMVTACVREDEGGLRVVQLLPGHVTVQAYGLAIDVGTTTIAIQLVNLADGRVFVNGTSYNGQVRRGADVISRIDYAKTPERLAEMQHLVLDTINGLISGRSADAGIPANEIRAVFISGNTTMIHLLLGLPPRFIRESPYVPTVNPVPALTAGEIGLAVNPQAVVGFAPGVGSYVGGDITAGLLCTEFTRNTEEVFLFLDIGTNGEIVLGNADWMVTCACSAGPAFEGSGIKCGMRATQGAIEYVEISSDGRSVSYDVIGDVKPAGICGSGLICLLGELFISGIVDQSGRFNVDVAPDRIVQLDSTKGFIIEFGHSTSDGKDLVVTELDIENLMRTKAAIYSACALILANVGLDWSAISKVYIAGGFGRSIHVDDAVLIGLLPDLPHDKFSYIGNSSLTGAYIGLLSQNRRRQLADIAAKMTYIDLSSDPHYMDSYLGALFLPHTNIAEFPTVAKRMENFNDKQTRS